MEVVGYEAKISVEKPGHLSDSSLEAFHLSFQEMDIAGEIRRAWEPYTHPIRAALEKLANASLPPEADFLHFILFPFELNGLPVTVWPTERNQQQHDGWELENELRQVVPESVTLPDECASTVETLDNLRDEVALFLQEQWIAIDPPSARLAYFSINDDGWYFSLLDGRKISAWDLEYAIAVQAGLG